MVTVLMNCLLFGLVLDVGGVNILHPVESNFTASIESKPKSLIESKTKSLSNPCDWCTKGQYCANGKYCIFYTKEFTNKVRTLITQSLIESVLDVGGVNILHPVESNFTASIKSKPKSLSNPCDWCIKGQYCANGKYCIFYTKEFTNEVRTATQILIESETKSLIESEM